MRELFQKGIDISVTAARRQRSFRWRYRPLDRARKALGPPPECDSVYVLPPRSVQGWILDAICREIDTHFPGSSAMVAAGDPLPPAKAYFYSHYIFFRNSLLRQPTLINARNLVWFSHPHENQPFCDEELVYLLNLCDAVVSHCSRFGKQLLQMGVKEDLLHVGLAGADPDFFRAHQRRHGKVGFCSGYVPRKNAERLLAIVQRMPEQQFALCGTKWRQWERFADLVNLANFEYIELPYSRYPEFDDSIDVFVSTSRLEGGPVPLLEAMMSNVVPVCSRTGTAEDMITDGENGFLFDVDAPTDTICDLIRKAKGHGGDIRSSVEHLSWQYFSRRIQQLAGLADTAASCPPGR